MALRLSGSGCPSVCDYPGPRLLPSDRHRPAGLPVSIYPHPEGYVAGRIDQHDRQGIAAVVQPGGHAVLRRVQTHNGGLDYLIGVETDHSAAPCPLKRETQPLPGSNMHDVSRSRAKLTVRTAFHNWDKSRTATLR